MYQLLPQKTRPCIEFILVWKHMKTRISFYFTTNKNSNRVVENVSKFLYWIISRDNEKEIRENEGVGFHRRLKFVFNKLSRLVDICHWNDKYKPRHQNGKCKHWSNLKDFHYKKKKKKKEKKKKKKGH